MHVRINAYHLSLTEVFDPSEERAEHTDGPMSIIWAFATPDGLTPIGGLTLTGDPAALELTLREALAALGDARNRRGAIQRHDAFIDACRTIGQGALRYYEQIGLIGAEIDQEGTTSDHP